MDKAAYFQSVYEAQFALGKKTGACLSAQYLALEVFLQRNDEWHFQWWPIVGISIHAWELLQQRAAQSGGNRMLSTQGIIRTHYYMTEWREGEHCLNARRPCQMPGTFTKPGTPRCWLSSRKEIRFTNSPGYPSTPPCLANKAVACRR